MEEKKPKTLSEHREHFAKFVALLTGDFGVQAVFGSEPGSSGSKKIVLPMLEELDGKRLDFLYALCLREAGILSMSKRTVASVASHKSQGELGASFAIESGRVERALMRKFAGANEILDQHWKKEAADPELSAMAFGLDPKKATIDQVFAFAAKWALVGKPSYGWDKLFPKAAWDECAAAVCASPIKELIDESRLRKWDDARELAGKVWTAWTEKRGGDKTPALTPSPKAKALAEAEKALRETIPNSISALTKEKAEADAKAKEASERSRSIMGDNASKLDELNRRISALGKKKAPFSEIAEHLNDAREYDAIEQSERQEQLNAQSMIDSVAEQAKARADGVKETAQGRAKKDDEKAREIQSKLDELAARKEQLDADPSISEEARQRIADLEEKIEAARHGLEEKSAEFEAKAQSEQAKAEGSTGCKRDRLEEKVRELREKIASQESKNATQEAKARSRMDEIKQAGEQRADSAKKKLEEQIDELEERLKKTIQEAQERQDKTMQKAAPGTNLQKRSQKAQNAMEEAKRAEAEAKVDARAARGEAAKAAAKNPNAKGLSEEELLAQIEKLESELASSREAKESIEAPARSAMDEARQARQEGKAANAQAALQAFGEMQKLQDKLDAQGIECDLVERLEEIEGWPEANDLQREFDRDATEYLGKPVINGAGGIGNGGRNALEEIALRAEGIDEINPNEIFSGVEKLSPLSGFSESGDKGGVGKDEKSHAREVQGFVSAKPHLVWRKDRDKVLPAPKRDGAIIGAIQRRYASEIAQVKRVFQARMKPSFKSKFRGGREEGQIDGRAIWKLAANQGDDFYEIDCKRPDNKASACILVDISGSLSSLGEKANERLQALALMLSEGLSECNIEHEVLGFSAPMETEFSEQNIPATFNRKSCRLETLVAKNFNEKSLAGLSSLEVAQADNSDGESLRVAVSRLKKRQGKKKIVFMISDGKPFMQDADVEILDEDLRRALIEAAFQKMSVVSVGFGANGHPVLGENHIGIDDIKDFPAALDKRLSTEK